MRRNLKLAILSKFKTQRNFSRKYNIDERRLSGVISGLYNPRPKEKEVIASALDRKPNDYELFYLAE